MPRELLMMQNSFEWEAREGQTLQLDNAIRSKARDLKIEGQTYQNLLSETKSLRKFVYDDITGEYTLTDPTVDSWNSMSINYTRPIQAGEKLLIRINIVKNTIEATDVYPLKIIFSDGGTVSTGFINIENGVTGLLEYYCDGASITEHYRNIFEITTRAYTSGELVIKDIQVIPVSSNPLSYTDKTKEYVSTKSEFNYPYVLENLKANTTYTLSYEIKSSNKITTNDKTTLFRIEKVTPDSNTIIKAGFTGTVDNIYRKHNITFDTESNTKQIKINLRNQFNASSIGLAENTLSVRNLVLLEGDYTNRTMITELPTSINGIESVAEREKGRNLLDINTFNPLSYSTIQASIDEKNVITVKGLKTADVEAYTDPIACNLKVYLEEGKTYSVSFKSDGKFGVRNGEDTVEIFFMLDGTTNHYFNVAGERTVTIPNGYSGYYYVRFDVNSGDKTHKFWDIQVKNIDEIDLYPINIVHSNNETDGITLPNGVKNTIENSVCIRKIGTYIITGNEAFTLRYENDSVIVIECRDLSIEIAFNDYWNSNVKMICDKAVCENCAMDTFVSDKLTTCSRTSSLKGFIIAIPKSLLTEYTIDKAKEYIKSLGGMTVYYELATPTTEPLTTTAISLPQPLRSLPNGVCDEVVGNKLVQRVGKYTCTGNETIVLEYNGGLARFKITIKNYKPNLQSIRRPVLSDKFTTTTAPENYVGLAFSYYACIYIYLEQTIKTVDSCKQWLLENKPTFYYELETPIVHEITQPIIPISKGGNIVTTINNIKPNLYIKYKKSKK